jgi:hypothetical protein
VKLLCYRSHASMEVQEQLWLCSLYVHALAIESYAEFYIREDRLAWALIVDPFMRPIRHKDLIV